MIGCTICASKQQIYIHIFKTAAEQG